MNAAINTNLLFVGEKHQSLYPMGHGDQAMINSMKLGNTRRLNNRHTTPRPNFQTVWATTYAATA